MNARERWQALQTQLSQARTSLEAGNRADALAAVDAALAIDPDFLAAHALRERIQTAAAAPAPPLVSPEGYAKFEQRARRRRVDRRIDAARAALAAGRIREAASALDEVIELDPNLPELTELTAEFDALRRGLGTSHVGRWVAAAAAFVIVVLGASWLQEAGGLQLRPLVAAAPALPTPEPLEAIAVPLEAAVDESAPAEPVATAGRVASAGTLLLVEPPPSPPPTVVPGYVPRVVAIPIAATASVSAPPSVTPPPVAPPTAASSPAAPQPPAYGPAASAVPAPVPAAPAPTPIAGPLAAPPPPTPAAVIPPDDRSLVQQVLQRYRSAYEGLDAHSARAVWPAVNEVALARAFDGLESQALTFDACDVRMRGESADATCRGSARYVPKIGSREPRVEPRTWNFVLRRNGAAWQIESARAER